MSDAILTATLLTALPAVVRITAMVMTMPLVATRVVPVRVKLAFILALSLAVVPGAVANSEAPSLQWTALLLTLINEVLVGALMGLSCAIMLSGIQIAGSVIEGLCGFSMVSFGAPADSETGGGPLGKLFWWTTVAVFVAAGGIGRMIDGLLFSFTALPTGTAVFDQSFLDFLVTSIGYAFEFGVSAALPAIAALLVASIVLGMVQRNFPQLGGLQVGLGIKAMFGMAVTSIVLLSTPWIINGGFELTLGELKNWLELRETG
ncbi:MAG: flagellar biosynthetic protein FliR [Pirellulaceae bacterium]|nr:flagellar biosynthetic protein FliR [Pirellulaceae bacterium]